MPQNKRQITRMRILNNCFLRKGKYWSKRELIESIAIYDIDISERTLDNDISNMRNCQQLNYRAPIEYSKSNNGYYYSILDYSIDNLPLHKEDIKALEFAATTLQQYQYIPMMKGFTSIINKIIKNVNRAKQENHATTFSFIQFEKTPMAIGLEHIDIITDAIINSSALNIIYQKFQCNKSSTVIIHPYLIKEYRNRWYIIGMKDQSHEIRTYALDRIVLVEPSDVNYIKNTSINTETYFNNCIGINQMANKIEKIILKFTPVEGNYIKTQNLHHSQKIIKDNDKELTIKLELIINFELMSIILGYGSSVKVIQPQHLADKVIEISKNTIERYNSIK